MSYDEYSAGGDPNYKAPLKTLQILWAAVTFSLVTFLAVGYFLDADGSRPEIATGIFSQILLLDLFAAVLTVMALVGVKRFIKNNYQTYLIIRLALGEAIGIFGLLVFLQGGTWNTFLLFLGWSFLLQLSAMPTQKKISEFNKTGK